MFPNFFLPRMALGSALFQQGDISAAIEEFQKAKAMEPIPLVIGARLCLREIGAQGRSAQIARRTQRAIKRRYVAPYWIAVIHVGLDEEDEAFSWLEKAYQVRSWFLVWMKMDPQLDSLRSDARFTDLMHRVRFPQ